MGYYLVDNPNPITPQFGWQRTKVSGAIGVHTAENNTCFNGPDGGAESVAAFIGSRSDYGSYHVLADADSIIHLVHPSWAAWADTTNNVHGMSVSGAVQAGRWLEMSEGNRRQTVINMAHGAAQMVQEAVAYGLLAVPTPARRITPQEAIAGTRAGFYGHGETNPGTRTDPGKAFDWDLFLTTYAGAVGYTTVHSPTITPIKPAPAPKEWYEMPIPNDDLKKIYEAVWFGTSGAKLIGRRLEKGGEWPEATLGSLTDRIIRQQLQPLRNQVASQDAQIKSLVGAVAAMSKGEPLDEAKLLAGVKAAAESGVKGAIDSIENTTTVNIKK